MIFLDCQDGGLVNARYVRRVYVHRRVTKGTSEGVLEWWAVCAKVEGEPRPLTLRVEGSEEEAFQQLGRIERRLRGQVED